MAKKKLKIDLESYGIYEAWNRKNIPTLVKFTTEIPVGPEVEFGYVLRLRGAKGMKIHFTIHHPPFRNEKGQQEPPFSGDVTVRKNDYRFFLGDTFWEPFENKAGVWELITQLNGDQVAKKTFRMFISESS